MNLLNQVLSFLFPEFCCLCGKPVGSISDGIVCHACWESTPLFEETDAMCIKCGLPNRSATKAIESFCNRCDEDFFDVAVALGPYEAALSASIVRLKQRPYLPRRISGLIFHRYSSSRLSRPDVVIPVPLSKRRRYERGFNQAELIASAFSSHAGLPIDTKSLNRSKHFKKSRAQMDRHGRRISVANAFEVQRPRLIDERKILLIDDVLTTGATASMAAKALKRAGAARVEVLTLARAG